MSSYICKFVSAFEWEISVVVCAPSEHYTMNFRTTK